jgi:hypothetical protein
MNNKQKAVPLRKWNILIEFKEHPKTGEKYELQSIKLKTVLMELENAKKLASKEAEKCWPFYNVEVWPV